MKRQSRKALLVAIVGVCGVAASAAQPTRASVKITGRVVIAGSQKPLAGADVLLASERGGQAVMSAETDEQGRFTLYEVPYGRYTLHAEKGSYLGGWLGQRTLYSQRHVYLDVSVANTPEVTLTLWPPAIITGTVTTEKGDPLVRVLVRAVRRTFVAGRAVLAPLAGVRTDDRGAYRMAGLGAGTYMMSATDSQRGIFYYPGGTSLATALPVTVNYGDERTDVDFVIPRQTSLSRVVGSIADWHQSRAEITLSAVDAGGRKTGFPVFQATADVSGKFDMPNVPDGDYLVEMLANPAPIRGAGMYTPIQGGNGRLILSSGDANSSTPWAPLPTAPTYWAKTALTVQSGTPLAPVQLQPQSGLPIRGRVVLDGTALPIPDLFARRSIRIFGADARNLGTIQLSGIASDGSFHTIGLAPGGYLLSVVIPGWHQVAVEVGGHVLPSDVIELGQELGPVTLRFASGDAPELSGTVRDDHGIARGDATVYVFPSDRALWMDFGPFPTRLVKITTDGLGRYSVRLPPGNYHARAVLDEVGDPWMEPGTLGRLATGAARVVVGKPGVTAKDLTIVQ